MRSTHGAPDSMFLQELCRGGVRIAESFVSNPLISELWRVDARCDVSALFEK